MGSEGEPESYVAELMSFVREEDLALLKIRPGQRRETANPAGRGGGGQRKKKWPAQDYFSLEICCLTN